MQKCNPNIAARLTAVREQNGYTRARLARELDKPYSTVSKYETGEREPGHSYLVEVATRFGVTTDYLLGLTDQPTRPRLAALSPQAQHLAVRYDRLDDDGRGAVQAIVDYEEARMQRAREAAVPLMRSIPLFGCRFAAGPAEPDFGSAWEQHQVPADEPADFAIRIHGDSMEPYLEDGSIALGQRAELRDGDVGAFLLDGEFLCKQVKRDGEGNVFLLSLNRARSDADVTVFASAGRNLQCFGKILLPRRVPLPRV